MTYDNMKPASSFSIVSRWARGPSQEHQHLAKCVTMSYNVSQVMTQTCYTATIVELHRNQLVFICNNEDNHRPIITSPQSSFWGVYKIS